MPAPIYKQRDLVWLKEPPLMPDGKHLDHPVMIISCAAANSKENHYTAVMMTASPNIDQFSFKVTDEMFESPLAKKNCQIRLYILFTVPEEKIKSFANRMKSIHFNNVIRNITSYVLAADS